MIGIDPSLIHLTCSKSVERVSFYNDEVKGYMCEKRERGVDVSSRGKMSMLWFKKMHAPARTIDSCFWLEGNLRSHTLNKKQVKYPQSIRQARLELCLPLINSH
jgi:hypothetical protein